MRGRGFTLVELVVVMAVAAILAVIALPGYRGVMHRAQRLDARLALQRIHYLQERHYARHLRYASELAGAGADALPIEDRTESGSYLLSVAAAGDGQSFVASALARPGGRQAGDLACQQLSVDQTGLQRSADSTGNWSSDNSNRCWG